MTCSSVRSDCIAPDDVAEVMEHLTISDEISVTSNRSPLV